MRAVIGIVDLLFNDGRIERDARHLLHTRRIGNVDRLDAIDSVELERGCSYR